MGKEGLRIAGVGLNFGAFAMLLVGVYSDHWKERHTMGDGIISGQQHFEGIWNNCVQKSTGHWECWEQPGNPFGGGTSNTFGQGNQSPRLPFVFYIYRGFTLISVVLTFTGLSMFMAGLEGIRLSKGDKNMKLKIAGGLNGLAFAMCLTVVILFRIFQWGNNPIGGYSGDLSMGYAMWCVVGTVLFSLGAAVLAFMGIEEDRGIYAAAPSFEPSAGANTYI